MDTRTRIHDLAARAGLVGVRRSVAIAVVVLLLVVIALALMRGRVHDDTTMPYTENVSAEPTSYAEPTDSRTTCPTASPVWVHVVGAVRNPDVYELPAGARIGDAVRAAGGLLGNAAQEGVNLARTVSDGEQVYVPSKDEWEAGAVPGTPGSPTGADDGATGLVNVNTADAATLDTLPGVGPATAERIVTDRDENGPFAAVEDLARVSGIGPAKLDAIRDLVCVN